MRRPLEGNIFYYVFEFLAVTVSKFFSMTDVCFLDVMSRGCYFQEGKEVKTEMKIEDAYQQSLKTVMHWINKELNSKKTTVFFRMFAPVHFR